MSRIAFLLALVPARGWAESPAATEEVAPVIPVERITGAHEAEMGEFSEIAARFELRMQEFKADTRSFIDLQKEERRAQINESYRRVIDGLKDEKDSLRTLAKARFETFLEKYPHAEYTPHVMFRLADLYFEEAEEQFFREDKDYNVTLNELGDDLFDLPPEPKKDYARPIELYEQIVANYPTYERMDGAYYMLGFCYADSNSVRHDPEQGIAAFQALVDKYPQSTFVNDASMRLGEYYFDKNQTLTAIPFYQSIVDNGEDARFYDQGLYKLAWSNYKLANAERVDKYYDALGLFMQVMDYSRRMLLMKGQKSNMEKEAIKYMAISFADISDATGDSATKVAEDYFYQAGEKSYEQDIMKELAFVLTRQARWEDAIAAYEYLQRRWPLDPENPNYQYKIAVIYNNLPVPDPVASGRANMELGRRYHDESDWWRANRNNPDALAVAKGYIEKSLAQVAIDYHRKAQASGVPGDYSLAAAKYEEYLKKFPFVDDYYEMEWYLADALFNANLLPEAEREYLQLLKTENHPFHDGALWRLMQTRRQRLIDMYGQVQTRPENAIVERTYQTNYGATITRYTLTEEHLAFIQTADEVVSKAFSDPGYESSRQDNLASLTYLPGQILSEFGHFDEARQRLFKVIERFPGRDEAAYSAGLIIGSYQEENDLQKVRLYTGTYARMQLGSSQEAQDKTLEFRNLEEGATFKIAENLIQEGKREEAAEAFLAFMTEFPESEHVKLALFNAANSLEIIGKADRANALFEQYINTYPTDEKSRGLFFRIASNYASILELNKAITYYRQLVRNFPDAEDAPAALFNAAFLQIGIGEYRGAAQDFESYATRFPGQPDAEAAFFTAGEQWESVGQTEAMSFYRRYLQRYGGVNADHSMKAQYRIIKILEESGKQKQADKEWTELQSMFAKFVAAGPVGPLSRRYAAEAEFRGIWDHFQSFITYKFTGKQEIDVPLIIDEKPVDLKNLEAECLSLIQIYQDFTFSSAAIYVQAAAYFTYADMLFQAPPPKEFGEEEIAIYQEKLDELRFPVEDKGKARAAAILEMAAKEKAWSEWQSKTIVLMNDRFPAEYPREKEEIRFTTKAWVSPTPGPQTILLPEPDDSPGAGGGQP